MLKATLALAFLSLIIKLLGFGREIALSYKFGTSVISDAYILSIAIPGLFFSIISSAINSAYIPYSNDARSNEERINLTNKLIHVFSAITLFICLLIYYFSSEIIELYTGSANRELISIANGMLKLTSFSLIVRIVIVILNSYLQVNGKWLSTTLVGLPLNLVVILSILMSSKDNYWILAAGFTIAMFLQLIVVIPFLIQVKYKYTFVFSDSRKSSIREFSRLMTFVMIATLINELNVVIDLRIGSQLGEGYVSAINYAGKLNILIQVIFVTSLSIIFFPKISKLFKAEQDTSGLLNQSITVITFLLIPVAMFTFFRSEEIITLVYDYGSFDAISVARTSSALKWYSIGFLAFGLREILVKYYYAANRMKMPIIFVGISTLVNILLTIVLSYHYQVSGIAMATSISAYIFAVAVVIDVYRTKMFKIEMYQFRKLAKCLIAAFAGIIVIETVEFNKVLVEAFVYLPSYILVSAVLKLFVYNRDSGIKI